MPTFNDLHTWRRKQGMTLKQAGKLFGVRVDVLSNIERYGDLVLAKFDKILKAKEKGE